MKKQFGQRGIVGPLAVMGALLIWQLAATFELVDTLFISSPVAVITAARDMLLEGRFGQPVLESLQSFSYGFVAAILTGIPLGIILGWFPRLGAAGDPILTTAYLTPRIALLPILVIWVGFGTATSAIVVYLGAVFPVALTTIAGVKRIDKVWLDACRSFGAGRLAVFRKVVLLGALPDIFVGIRLGLARGILGVIIAEMYASVGGVGGLIMLYGAAFRTDRLLVLVLLVGAFGAAATSGIGWLSRRLLVYQADAR